MNRKKKKKWSRPVCEKVRLVPEEAVLWGCKSLTGATGQEGFFGTCITGATCPSAAS